MLCQIDVLHKEMFRHLKDMDEDWLEKNIDVLIKKYNKFKVNVEMGNVDAHSTLRFSKNKGAFAVTDEFEKDFHGFKNFVMGAGRPIIDVVDVCVIHSVVDHIFNKKKNRVFGGIRGDSANDVRVFVIKNKSALFEFIRRFHFVFSFRCSKINNGV
mgnify:CR=1 FL=1